MRPKITLIIIILAISAMLAGLCGKEVPQPVSPHPIESVLHNARIAAVRVSMESEGEYSHIGSGFVVAEDGYIVTARHVANKGGKYRVSFADGTELDAKVAFISSLADCAVLKVRHKGLAHMKIRSQGPRLGETVFTVGTPISTFLENYITCGIVSKLRVSVEKLGALDVFMIDAAVSPGNSGGPVIDTDGRVVGMVIARVPGAVGLNFAVYAEDIADVLGKARGGKTTD